MQFWVIADTVTKNSTQQLLSKVLDSGWSFAGYNDTNSQEVQRAVYNYVIADCMCTVVPNVHVLIISCLCIMGHNEHFFNLYLYYDFAIEIMYM